ncbi:Derlin-like protein [Giardia muris]|uniref:Derlin n=1 Tax=Giardia muris TaxID=5742 RepID=A0A4Z1TB73_GIAMU|nr:Derlin-like protein [Giardia muris]|eukprot:TNJ30497.1 Derlin-like protein [Giardia muris]
MPDFLDLLHSIPTVSRILLLTSSALSLLTFFEVISPYSLYLSWPGVIERHEVWRLFTPLLFIGKLSLQTVFSILQNSTYVSSLEGEVYVGRGKVFIFFLLYDWLACILATFLYPMYYLSTPFFGAITYLWGRKSPEKLVSLFGIVLIQACYLPFIYFGFALIQKQNVIPILIGICIGHIFYFLEDILPRATGKRPIDKVVHVLFR